MIANFRLNFIGLVSQKFGNRAQNFNFKRILKRVYSLSVNSKKYIYFLNKLFLEIVITNKYTEVPFFEGKAT